MRGGVRVLFVLAVVGAAAVDACSLNPQPIPPGEQPDSGSNSDFGSGGASTDAATNNPAPGDSGTRQDLDGAAPGADGGEDASDAATDDAGDAEADADAS